MKTIACLVVKSPKVFGWLGHMPLMSWAMTQLQEVRGIDRIVCVAESRVAAQARKLLTADDVDTVVIPDQVADADETTLDRWISAAGGPGGEADAVVVMHATAPFMPAAKIEACLAQVTRKRCSACAPARTVAGTLKARPVAAVVLGVRAFAVRPPAEPSFKTVAVNLLESLDVSNQDEFVIADALVSADKL